MRQGEQERIEKRIIARDIAFVVITLTFLVIPWFMTVDSVAWLSIGALLAIAVVHPRALVLTVPAAIGISFRPFPVGELEFNILEVLTVASAVGYFPRLISTMVRFRYEFRAQPRQMFRQVLVDPVGLGLSMVLLVAGIISLMFLADPGRSSESLRVFRWTILFPVVYFGVALLAIRSDTHRFLAGGLFVAGAVLAGFIAIIDGIAGGGISADQVTRVSGMAPHPNALAFVLERATVFSILIAIVFRSRLSSIWLSAGVFLAVVSIFTFSRGAIAAIAVAIVAILMLSQMRRIALYAFALAGGLVAAMAFTFPERILSLLRGGSGSLRLELWRSAVAVIRDNPLFGLGPDQFLYQYLPRYVTPEAWPERFTSHPHNLLLDTWISLGIIGMVALGFLVFAWWKRTKSAIASRDQVAVAASGAILAGAIHGMLDQGYFLPELAFSFWFLFFLLGTITGSTETNVEKDDS
jgi:putative inorganic carbon (hco3(-)) transporter